QKADRLYEMPKIGHLCFPIAFFGHFQYTLTDQERIPHSPSGGDFHGKEGEDGSNSAARQDGERGGRIPFCVGFPSFCSQKHAG
ncbi:hypothetical protein, partial [Geobacillus stearothermophilus]|uniref:hypothetical protein n=1 Tax=Geobacillus stearothermophilus TaxID=1422 RepID=UPI002E1F5BC1|nr:hypothetical protein [Geobacillus stearothermophilus]